MRFHLDMAATAVSFASFLIVGIAAILLPKQALCADPWLDAVKRFDVGASAGFGQDSFPRVVLGRPEGGGALVQSTDVLSLGEGGSIVCVFRDNLVYDGPGDDLVVYENAFHVGSLDGPLFTEFGYVEVSADNHAWYRFDVNPETGAGLAGRSAVLANSENEIDPLSAEAGGDRFDIADVGLAFVRFVRIIDVDGAIEDRGDFVPPVGKGGFDLDAMGAIHSTRPAVVRGVVTHAGEPIRRARVKLIPLDGSRRKRRWTRSNGSFRFRGILPVGEHRVRVVKAGVGSATDYFTVDLSRLRADLDLVLE
jgi:hypothetical protein